ncbi:MAG TPA: alpha-2-macroglobulin family protein [Henriciella marina]|uniref:alpha-2-macroglobulin family protein n=1 Tax=Henriciella sp. TaxID=1968823 RepID=UPI0018147C7E|nr:alpha-2-macroglobulin [Henriciella sp.]HIG21170.1 alpha-2-macroglobulin family protein [Henriciella sp.]HIK66021.1 alpha-2-macroglobulin family protein [Henriciella marina]
MAGWTNRARGLILGGLTAMVVACGIGDEPPAPVDPETAGGEVVERSRAAQAAAERRERERQALAEAEENRFVYFRYAPDTSGVSPRACLVFSQPLDPEINYATYIRMQSDVRPAFAVEGRELCLEGLDFASGYTATILEGLPSADGRTIEREEEVQISFEDRPAYVGFDGAGVILPRDDADGLAIETVNVDAVEISVYRVNDRALAFKSISQGDEAAQGRYSYLYGEEDPRDVSTEVWSGSMDIDNVTNAPVTTVFPLQDVIGELRPGSYFVELTDAKELDDYDGPAASARRWIMLTNLALTAYRAENGMDVTLRSLQDGEVLPNTRVQLIAYNNEVLGEAETGEDGRVRFEAPLLAGEGNSAPRMIMAFGAKGDLAVLDLSRAPVDLSEMKTGGRVTPGPVDGYLYADRGIFRPGETVHLTTMMRDRGGSAVTNRAGQIVIYRPNGVEADRMRFTEAEAGALVWDYELSRTASRGMWRAVLSIDGAGEAGSLRFSVEDFVPQRIAVELDGEEESFIAAGGTREIEVEARFLYGAPGAGLTVEGQARLEAHPRPFEALNGFTFGRADEQFRERIVEFEPQTTDGAGRAVVRLNPGDRGSDSSRPLRLNTNVSVLEPGGRAVTESVRIPYRPRDSYVGIRKDFDGRADRDGPAAFELAAVSANGEIIDTELNWRVIEIEYHYDWYRDGSEWRWRRSRTVSTFNEGVVQTDGTTQTISVDGLDWGQHELIVSDVNGDAEASTGFYVGWGGSVSDDGVEAPDRVEVIVEEQTIVPGRPAAITVIPPYDGEAQIVVATDKILRIETRDVSAEGTQFTLPVTEEWGEGAYVLVNVYTPRDPVLQAKPRRAVGVGYVPLDMDERTFDVAINAPEIVRPRREQTIEIELGEGPRENVYLTLAAVDEGILQLTKFQSPDPVSYYFGKKSLGVDIFDDYGRLLDPNMGLPAEVRTGGDQLGGEGLSVVPTKTVALFSGMVDVGRSGRARVTFDVPDFNGELRLMAVVWSQNGLGSASRPLTVRDPAPAELILPRFLAPGDEAVATVSIDNIELDDGTFTASLDASEPVSVAATELSRTIPSGQRVDEGLRISADETGISDLRLNMSGPGNYSVVRHYEIESRSPWLPATQISTATMEPGDSWSIPEDLLEDYVPGTSYVSVTFSTLPLDANALYASLARYPYGCTEQTVSRALPLLYSEQLVAMGADETSREPARAQIQEAVSAVLNRQSAEGAFGLWREGDRNASPWLGAYTTDFVYRASEAGYEVPEVALERAFESMRAVAQGDAWRAYGYDTDVWESEWHNDTEAKLMRRASAYALYVLAKAGRADISRLRYLHDRELERIESPLARAHLGAALAFMGDRSRAFSAFEAAEDALGYQNTGDYYQTPLRDLTGIIALAAEADFDDVVARLAEQLGDDAPDPSELTTQEKAFALLAVNSMNDGGDDYRMVVEGLGNGNNNDRRYQLSEEQARGEVSFTLGQNGPAMFRTVMVRGAPSSPPPAVSSDLRVTKQVRTLTGGAVDLGDVDQGDQLVVTVQITPEQRRTNPVIVADLLPAGFEIETVLKPADGARDGDTNGAFAWAGEINEAKTAEARDDRFVAAIDVRNEAVRLGYVVRAVTPGEFVMPGVTAEDMYRPDVFARSAPGRLTISTANAATGGQR